MSFKAARLVAYGFIAGTAGVKLLSSKDAKNVYTKATAAVLRCKDSILDTVDTVKENCGDIKADALEINEERKDAALVKEIAKAKEQLEAAQARLEQIEAEAKDADLSPEA